MNLQLHDILVNPALLKDVSDDTLQSWIQQYPYVSLFHLYALKKKNKYSESDLHKTAFYFNNREKLYFLLNDKQFESKVVPVYEKTNTVAPPIEIKQAVAEEIVKPIVEERVEPVIEEETIEETEEKIEETALVEHHEQQTAIIEEPIAHKEVVLLDDISTAVVEEEKAEEIIIEEELKLPIEEIQETIVPIVITEDKPLSIADKIMLEIQQLKEERARKANQTEVIEETTVEEKIVEVPVIEAVEEKIELIEEPVIEEEKTDATIEEESAEEDEITEEKEEVIEETEIQPVPEIIETTATINQEEIKETETVEKPLSIQDEIIARINKIKEERLLGISEEKNLSPVIKEEVEIPIQENIEVAEEKETVLEPVTEDIIEEKEIELVAEKEEVVEPIIETIIEEPKEETVEATTEEINLSEKPLSIQDELIARINKIKEERERKITEAENTTFETKEEIKTPILENVEVVKETILEEKKEEEEEEEIKKETTTTEKVLSIQDEIIARIQRIKEERALKLNEENNTTPIVQEEIKTEIPIQETVEIPEVIDEPEKTETIVEPINEEETVAEKESDIKIVEKTARPIVEIIDENKSAEEILVVPTTDEHEKDIELRETKQHQLLETSKDALHASSEEEETDSTEIVKKEINQFEEIFPAPLLVHVDASQLKNEKTPVTLEQLQEETIVPIKDIVENKTEITETVKEIIEEKQDEEIAEHTSLISKKSDLFIPSVEEDKIEAKSEEKIEEENIQHSTLNIQHLKEEPHTFVEWLKLLDGTLQIQTAETAKETDNWIEIPRYEVEQAIANKKEILKEEQKLFEPNFEEGEVDLFNEIDEEVSKVASESVSFKQDMMTETLAKIYHKQGKTDKALEIYNTLLMKFPEKSAYFASLIQKIEKEK